MDGEESKSPSADPETPDSVATPTSSQASSSPSTFASQAVKRGIRRRSTGLSTIVEHARERWSQFSFFGVGSEDVTVRIWGSRVRTSMHPRNSNSSGISDEVSGSCYKRSSSNVLSKMVKQHAYQDEMKMQLRDERIRLSYLDTFESDIKSALATIENRGACRPCCLGHCLVRVFSFGATLLEYLKIVLAVWTFFVALAVVSFWEVLKPLSDQKLLLYVDLSVDLVFAICLSVQLRTTILVVQTGREYCMPGRILRAHLKDIRFWMDVISCVPLIFFQMFAGGGRIRLALIKALRGWRISRMPPEHQFVPSNTFLVLQLAGLILMGGHLLACIWFIIVYETEGTMRMKLPLSSTSGEAMSPHAERYEVCLGESPPACFWELYTVSFMNGVYLLMGIDREAHSAFEHLFVTLCAPVGLLVHACMLGEIVLLIQRRGALETRQNEQTLAIQEAMRILGLPPNLQMRISAFFTYERIHRSGRLFDALFAHLSPQLRFELHLHLYLGLVRQSKLFRRTRPRVIREIVVKLQDVIFLPGDWVCRYGDYGDSMYFIVAGKCVVIGEDTTTELQVLERGRYFGEVALLTSRPRTAYVRANTFCAMAQLTKEGFAPIVRQWPEEIDVLIEEVEKDSDRIKIKAEASRHYGLRRSSSVGSSNVVPAQDIAIRSSVGYSSIASRRDSRLSVSSVPSSSGREAALRKWSQCSTSTANATKSEAQDQCSSTPGRSALKHSSSAGPLTLRELSFSNQEGKRRTTSCSDLGKVVPALRAWVGKAENVPMLSADGKVDARHAQISTEAAPPLHPTLLGSGLVGSTSPLRSDDDKEEEEEDCRPIQSNSLNTSSSRGSITRTYLALSSADAVVLEEDNINVDAEHTPSAGMPSSVQVHEMPQKLPEQEEIEAAAGSDDLAPLPAADNSDVTEEGTLLETTAALLGGRQLVMEQVQCQISDIVNNVTHLQAEVLKQRDMLTESLADMKHTAVEAVKEAVAQELAKLRGSGTRRSSAYSDLSNDSWAGHLPGSPEFADVGISTPFT